ncbi:MAG: hypothetical protein ACR2II_02955 [Chthoniobacterales bacterium]
MSCKRTSSFGLRCAIGVALLFPFSLRTKAGNETVPKSPDPAIETKSADVSLFNFWDGRLTFDIEERIRAESRETNRDFDSSAHDDNDDSWLLNRFLLGLAFKPVTWLKLYVQTQDRAKRSPIARIR